MSVLEEYLKGISNLLKTKNSDELQKYLRVEPGNDLPQIFNQLSNELRKSYMDGSVLELKIAKLVPENDDANEDEGACWPGFTVFIKEYLEYWRDAKFDDLLETHTQLSGLANACITAFSNSQYGIMVLPATIQLCEALAKLAMTLDKRPDLTSRLRKVANLDQGETRKSLVEGTAESIQRAFTMCLTERSINRNGIKDGKPEGKKIGIYSFANLVLKLLFQCRKTRLANQLFTNISQHSPPLGLYSDKQRVTYLYYLGRFHFSNNHFYRAQLCLQSAYDQCAIHFTNHRRLILIYLISSNMILGRFPSPAIPARPEAVGIIEKFTPIAQAIRYGNMVAFKRALGPESGNEQWFFKKGILLPLLSRCEVLVWRSLARHVFVLTYHLPSDPNSKKAPTLDFAYLLAAVQYCQKILEGWQKPVDSMTQMQSGRQHPNAMFMKSPNLVPPPAGPKWLSESQGVLSGNMMPKYEHIEALVASLVQQGLLHGYLSAGQGKFAILGSKQRGGAAKAGFPAVWEVLRSRAEAEGRDSEVPGWVRIERKGGMGGVVNLSGIARPVGSGG